MLGNFAVISVHMSDIRVVQKSSLKILTWHCNMHCRVLIIGDIFCCLNSFGNHCWHYFRANFCSIEGLVAANLGSDTIPSFKWDPEAKSSDGTPLLLIDFHDGRKSLSPGEVVA